MWAKQYSIQAFGWLINLLVFLTIVLPTGTILSLNYKIGIIALIVPIFIYISLVYGIAEIFIVWLFGFLLFLGVYFLLSFLNDVQISSVVSHILAFFSLFSVVYFSLFLISCDKYYKVLFKKTILLSSILYSVVKISASFLISVGFFYPDLVQGVLKSIFNFEFIGLDASYFYRVHLPIDYLLPVAFLYLTYLSNDDDLVRYKRVFQFIIFLAILISYSRFLYFIFMILYAIIFIDYVRRFQSEKLFIVLLLGVFFLGLVGMLSFDFISERYFGVMASESDGPRLDMYYALVSIFEKYPLLGKGLGSGSELLIRFEDMPWYYELQWLSFLAQFGIVGFVLLLFVALLPFGYLYFTQLTSYSFTIYILYLAWLSVGIFNGFMLTSSAGVIFLFFILMLIDLDNREYPSTTICKDIS